MPRTPPERQDRAGSFGPTAETGGEESLAGVRCSLDPDGLIVDPGGLGSALGCSASALEGKSLLGLADPEDAARLREAVEAAGKSECPARVTCRISAGGRAHRWFEVCLSRVTPGRAEGGLDCRVHDVSDLMKDGKHRERTIRLEREREELRHAVRSLEHVLGIVGHELRTPLSGLRVMAELVLSEDPEDTQRWRESMEYIHRGVVEMSASIESLLEAAVINSGRVKWNWGVVYLPSVCHVVIETVQAIGMARTFKLVCDVSPRCQRIKGDRDGIRRLLMNLVSNACQHTRRGGVRIIVEPDAAEPGKWLDIIVEDTGVGIPPEVMGKLGEPFALNSGLVGLEHANGAGLGLFVCRSIVGAHGGAIYVGSEPGVGTTIRARIRADLDGPAGAGDDGAPVIIERYTARRPA